MTKAATTTAQGAPVDDGELATIGETVRRLNALQDDARVRVLVYLVSRYGLRDVLESLQESDR